MVTAYVRPRGEGINRAANPTHFEVTQGMTDQQIRDAAQEEIHTHRPDETNLEYDIWIDENGDASLTPNEQLRQCGDTVTRMISAPRGVVCSLFRYNKAEFERTRDLTNIFSPIPAGSSANAARNNTIRARIRLADGTTRVIEGRYASNDEHFLQASEMSSIRWFVQTTDSQGNTTTQEVTNDRLKESLAPGTVFEEVSFSENGGVVHHSMTGDSFAGMIHHDQPMTMSGSTSQLTGSIVVNGVTIPITAEGDGILNRTVQATDAHGQAVSRNIPEWNSDEQQAVERVVQDYINQHPDQFNDFRGRSARTTITERSSDSRTTVRHEVYVNFRTPASRVDPTPPTLPAGRTLLRGTATINGRNVRFSALGDGLTTSDNNQASAYDRRSILWALRQEVEADPAYFTGVPPTQMITVNCNEHRTAIGGDQGIATNFQVSLQDILSATNPNPTTPARPASTGGGNGGGGGSRRSAPRGANGGVSFGLD